MSLVSLGGIGQAFQSRNFQIFFWGQLNLTIGAWVYRLALAWLAWELTHSTAWLGIVAAGQMVPILVLCPIAAVTSDRHGHKLQLIVAIAASGLSGLLMAVLAAINALSIEGLTVLAVINGATRAFAIPPRQALLPALAEPQLFPAVVGFQSATYYGANFIGPALGGVLIAWSGAGAALGYFTFGAAVAAASLPFMRVERALRIGVRASFVADLVEGFRYAARHPGIRMMILMVGVVALCVQPVVDMLAGVADRVLFMGEDGLAILAAIFGGGAAAGGLWIAWRGRTEGLTRILLAGMLAGLAALAVFALSSVVWLSAAALFVIGAVVVVTSTAASSLIQNAVEPALRARVMALDSMLSTGAPALGAIVIGWAGAHFGIQAPLCAAAVLGVAVLVLARRQVWRESAALEATQTRFAE